MTTNQQLANQLITWLLEQKKTHKAAGLANEANIDAGTVSRWLTGKTKPNRQTVARLSAVAQRYGFIPTI